MQHEWKNKRVTVMGLGLQGGGESAVRFFCRQGARVIATDLKTRTQLISTLKKLRNLKVQYVLGRHRREDFTSADLIIKNPGVPNDSSFLEAARKSGVPVENEASVFFQYSPAPIIGITGTNGKGTVATLVTSLLKKKYPGIRLAGNIGKTAMLDILPKLDRRTPIVLELSSWQLEGLEPGKVSPGFALVTNITQDHLNRYRSLHEYARSKSIIVRFQKKSDTVVLNRDDKIVSGFKRLAKGKVIWFSLQSPGSKKYQGTWVDPRGIWFQNHGRKKLILSHKDIAVRGEHNLANIASAIALAKCFDVSDAHVKQTVGKFRGLPYRLETVRRHRGVRWINDSISSSPETMIAAIEAISQDGPIVLIAGGVDKNLDYRRAAKIIRQMVKTVILFPGTATEKLRPGLKEMTVRKVSTMSQAVKMAQVMAEKNDQVLLSPGAASFNLFTNAYDRARQFNREVEKLQ
ncbi:MAG: UDP-N-acetylmuramoyl-L-alanine--D-glutamate ligase [bacterium]|nr:UDP-N-acetylmuramoyl-L-alanine--D-glutamate ligase [bacterium]